MAVEAVNAEYGRLVDAGAFGECGAYRADSIVMDMAGEPAATPSNPDSPYSEGGTAVMERPGTETQEQRKQSDDGDADRYAHYVSKSKITESRMTGRPVVALCGKIWVPKHDPSAYPVCPDCKRIYEEMMK